MPRSTAPNNCGSTPAGCDQPCHDLANHARLAEAAEEQKKQPGHDHNHCDLAENRQQQTLKPQLA
jgi:hypothetical protein